LPQLASSSARSPSPVEVVSSPLSTFVVLQQDHLSVEELLSGPATRQLEPPSVEEVEEEAPCLSAPEPFPLQVQDLVMADMELASSGPAQAEVPPVSGTWAVMPAVSSEPAQAEVPAVSSTSEAVMPAVMAQAAVPAASGTLPAAVPSAKPRAAGNAAYRSQSKRNKMP